MAMTTYVAQSRAATPDPHRVTVDYSRAAMLTATLRNRLVASLADELLIAYGEPGGKTTALAQKRWPGANRSMPWTIR